MIFHIKRRWIFAAITAIIWYAIIYYILYALTYPISIGRAALILLVLFYVSLYIAPWLKNRAFWGRLFRRKNI